MEQPSWKVVAMDLNSKTFKSKIWVEALIPIVGPKATLEGGLNKVVTIMVNLKKKKKNDYL